MSTKTKGNVRASALPPEAHALYSSDAQQGGGLQITIIKLRRRKTELV